MAQRRGLAGGADRHEAVDSGGDLALDEFAERDLVQHAIPERGDERRDHALEQRFRHRPAIINVPLPRSSRERATPQGDTSRKRHTSDRECLPATAVSRITSLSDPTPVI